MIIACTRDTRQSAASTPRQAYCACTACYQYIIEHRCSSTRCFFGWTMPKTRQQTTPRELPTRAAKRRASEASATIDGTSASVHTTPNRPQPGPSAKKQKVEPAQQEASDAVDNKENTASGSQPRRSARARTARVVQEVTPGPGLVKPVRSHARSNSKQVSQSAQEQPVSASKQVLRSREGASKSTALDIPDGQRTKNTSDDELSDIDLEDLEPESASLPQRNTDAVASSQTSEGAAAVPSEPFSSPQDQAPAFSDPAHIPAQLIPLPSPCTHPSDHGLAPIPHQQPESPQKPSSPAAGALATSSPAPAPTQAAATLPAPDSHALCDQSSQDHSRHSSGHSNDHPVAVLARKHLDWDSAGATSCVQSANSKPPLSRCNPGVGPNGPEAVKGSAAEANGDQGWWDPTDVHKVRQCHICEASLCTHRIHSACTYSELCLRHS